MNSMYIFVQTLKGMSWMINKWKVLVDPLNDVEDDNSVGDVELLNDVDDDNTVEEVFVDPLNDVVNDITVGEVFVDPLNDFDDDNTVGENEWKVCKIDESRPRHKQ